MNTLSDQPQTDNDAQTVNEPCLTCSKIHPTCENPGCNNPTRCPPDEPGEPFLYCDTCDTEYVNRRAGEVGAA